MESTPDAPFVYGAFDMSYMMIHQGVSTIHFGHVDLTKNLFYFFIYETANRLGRNLNYTNM